MGMTQIGYAMPGGTVNVLVALRVPERCALSAHDGEVLFDVHAGSVLVFDFDDIHKFSLYFLVLCDNRSLASQRR
jgi:hypothetical protein